MEEAADIAFQGYKAILVSKDAVLPLGVCCLCRSGCCAVPHVSLVCCTRNNPRSVDRRIAVFGPAVQKKEDRDLFLPEQHEMDAPILFLLDKRKQNFVGIIVSSQHRIDLPKLVEIVAIKPTNSRAASNLVQAPGVIQCYLQPQSLRVPHIDNALFFISYLV